MESWKSGEASRDAATPLRTVVFSPTMSTVAAELDCREASTSGDKKGTSFLVGSASEVEKLYSGAPSVSFVIGRAISASFSKVSGVSLLTASSYSSCLPLVSSEVWVERADVSGFLFTVLKVTKVVEVALTDIAAVVWGLDVFTTAVPTRLEVLFSVRLEVLLELLD